jgi:hypothetical protein
VVVLVHGLVVTSRYMVPTAERLAPITGSSHPTCPASAPPAPMARTLTSRSTCSGLTMFGTGHPLPWPKSADDVQRQIGLHKTT